MTLAEITAEIGRQWVDMPPAAAYYYRLLANQDWFNEQDRRWLIEGFLRASALWSGYNALDLRFKLRSIC